MCERTQLTTRHVNVNWVWISCKEALSTSVSSVLLNVGPQENFKIKEQINNFGNIYSNSAISRDDHKVRCEANDIN